MCIYIYRWTQFGYKLVCNHLATTYYVVIHKIIHMYYLNKSNGKKCKMTTVIELCAIVHFIKLKLKNVSPRRKTCKKATEYPVDQHEHDPCVQSNT